MSYELFLAIRYLRSRRRRKLARVTAAVAILGIAVGVAAMIVALALANGFRDEMREKILRGTAHVNVMRADGRPMTDYREISSRLSKVGGVASVTGTTFDGAVIVGPGGSAYAVLRGIDRDSPQAVDEVSASIVEGSVSTILASTTKEDELPGVLIGAELATRTGLRTGDIAEIISANFSLPTITPLRRSFRVAGIFRSGLFEYDSAWIYLPLEIASKVSGTTDAASVVSVQLVDIYDAKRAATEIRSTLGTSYTVVDWEEANRPLFNALGLERRMGAVIIALIILVAALNITTTLILLVVERRRDIGILRAMGATTRGIMGIFVIEGAIIGAFGAFLGIALGGLACLLGNRYQLVSLPADVYSITNVPFHAHPRDMLLAAAVAFLLSLVATIYPARAAARVQPAEMIREAN